MWKHLALVSLLAACNTQPAPEVVRVKADEKPITKLGAPITQPATPLAAIMNDPASFKGKTVATSGTVTKVCQHQGCWMAIRDGEKDAMVRMHAHAFFVPPNASVGRKARVQGTLVLMKDGKECEEMTEQNKGAQLELDATGVELEPN